MSYTRPEPAPRILHAWEIPAGDEGGRTTVAHMCAMAHADAPLLPYRYHDAAALRRWLMEHTVYQDDPVGVELVRSPARMLRAIERQGRAAGDCDDIATLAAALALASGMRARLVLASLADGVPYEHVYAEVLDPASGEWSELDVVAEVQGMPRGWRPARVEYHPLDGIA